MAHTSLHKIYQQPQLAQNQMVAELLEKYPVLTDFVQQTSVIYEIYLMRSGHESAFDPGSIKGYDGMIQAVKAMERFEKPEIRVCEVEIEEGSVLLFLDPDSNAFIGIFLLQ